MNVLRSIRRFCTPVFAYGFASLVFAHEPVFSLGPETIWDGGWGLGGEFEFDGDKNENTSALHYEVIYGVTTDLSLSIAIPQILARKAAGATAKGLGDIQVRAKREIYRKDLLGAQHKITVIAGVKLPTGDDDARPAVGSGTTDYLLGVSYGYESRTLYQFLTARHRLNAGAGGNDPGRRFTLDGAVGYRPLQREYTQWDLVVLLEGNAEVFSGYQTGGASSAGDVNSRIMLGPSVLFSPNPRWMVKGGAQTLVFDNLGGTQDRAKNRFMFGVETHF